MTNTKQAVSIAMAVMAVMAAGTPGAEDLQQATDGRTSMESRIEVYSVSLQFAEMELGEGGK